ncbi:MAG: hypothetical protein JWP01_2962 [Myxococcales bacterium]|nr:hypothetical protein [Myxococcales bacterium]
MRKLPAAIAISTAVHAVAVACVLAYTPAAPPEPTGAGATIELVDVQRTEPPAPIEPVDDDIVPVDVTLLDAETLAAIPEQPAIAMREETPRSASREERTTDRRPDPADRVAISSGTGTAIREPGTGTGSATEPGTGNGSGASPMFDMRKGKPVRLTVGVPTGRWDGRENAPETYGPDIDSGQLDNDGGGTYRADQGPFTAKVERDGSVNLKDKRNLNFRFGLPSPKKMKRAVASWYTDPNKPVGSIGPNETDKPRVNLGESSGEDRKPDHGGTVPIVGGGFDVTDALMRRKGIDPYASKKLKFLDSTRDERVQIGQRYRQQQLAQATQIMKTNLDRMWSTITEPVARRQALFELWDECAETGTEDLVIAGRAARKLVVGFIRTRVPAGSAGAYSADELAAFNRKKQSKATFAPYE